MYIPHVIEKNGDHGERAYDVYSRLLKDRIIMLAGPVEPDLANGIVAQLLFLSNQDPEAPIKMYINSPGGSVVDGLMIIDTMNLITSPVHTYNIGQASSMGAVILSCGDKRFMMEHATVMIHQPSSGTGRASASDIEIVSRHVLKIRNTLNSLLSKNTGQLLEKVAADCDRDYYMDSEESLRYGIVDEVLRGKKGPRVVKTVGEIEV